MEEEHRIVVRKPTVQSAMDTLRSMKDPSVIIPGAITTIGLFLLGTNMLFSALAAFGSLYVHMLWTRLSVTQE